MSYDHPPLAAGLGAATGHPALRDPWAAALEFGAGTVMAVLVATEGPAYRRPGAAMAIAADGRSAGGISGGCIEADLILQARAVRAEGRARQLRYGRGSAFIDLRLPCGGAIEVLLLPLGHDLAALAALARVRAARCPAVLTLGEGGLTLGEGPGWRLMFRPAPRLVIFGAGVEAAVFAGLVQALAGEHLLLSHDPATLAAARGMGCFARSLRPGEDPGALLPDNRCAALLFYHDHDHEPALLRRLLAGPAFYIGAQGSRATQARRLQRLAALGVPAADCARLRGPMGLVAGARDPQSLAISVLAEVTAALPAGVDLVRG